MKVTREMISAAHGVTIEHGDIVLSHRILERIYLAMDAAANREKILSSPLVPLSDDDLCKVLPAIATYTEANKTLYRSIARAIERAHGIK